MTTRSISYAAMAALVGAALSFAPHKAAAQGPPGGGGSGSSLQDRVLALEEGLAAEITGRHDADRAEEEARIIADDEERAERESADAHEAQARIDADNAEAQARADADAAEAATRRRGDEEEALAREEGDQALRDSLTIVTDVLCGAIQRIPGNPSPEAVALCGARLSKTVFVTSTLHDGDLKTAGGGASGLEGGDNICNARAREAGLAGTYTAWLSSSVIDAKDRVTQAMVPYVRVDGVQVADNFADILDCSDTCLDNAVALDENGGSAALNGLTVWTGTNQTGAKGFLNQCVDWTTSQSGAFFGDVRDSGPRWTGIGWRPCTEIRHLYCFQD